MAKSNSGGTRTFIRGRVGSDVYSIGKDAQGKKLQIVRSLAESVANPQTLAQMRGRMIMSTVMQAVSSMAAIIDHSFDGLTAGQPCISEFISRNYALVKADAAAHPANGNQFGLNAYKEKGVKQGTWEISDGKGAGISGIVFDAAAKTATIAVGANATLATLRSTLGIAAGDYFTLCFVSADKAFGYLRFHVSQTLSADTVISADNVGEVFTFDGNIVPSIALNGNNIVVTLSALSANYGVIVSRAVSGGFIHNNVVLAAVENPTLTADNALPTYPVGQQRFLNGGGESEVTPFSPEPEPEPDPFTARISAVTVNGQNLTQNGTVSSSNANFSVAVTLNGWQDGHTVKFGPQGSTIDLTGAQTSGSIQIFDIGAQQCYLWVDGQIAQSWGSLEYSQD